MSTTGLAGAGVNAHDITAKDAHDGSHFHSQDVPAPAPAPDTAPRDRRYGWAVCQACYWWVPVTGALTTAGHAGCTSINADVPLWAVNFAAVNPNSTNDAPSAPGSKTQLRTTLQPCGSHAAFNRHKLAAQPIDLACEVGERVYQRNRKRRTRLRAKDAA
jgi:hypothetical protein